MCKQEKGRIMNIYAKKTYQEEEEDFRLRRLASFTFTAHIPHNRKLHEHGFMLTLTFNKTTLARLKVKAIFTKRVASSVKCTIESRPSIVVVGYQAHGQISCVCNLSNFRFLFMGTLLPTLWWLTKLTMLTHGYTQ